MRLSAPQRSVLASLLNASTRLVCDARGKHWRVTSGGRSPVHRKVVDTLFDKQLIAVSVAGEYRITSDGRAAVLA